MKYLLGWKSKLRDIKFIFFKFQVKINFKIIWNEPGLFKRNKWFHCAWILAIQVEMGLHLWTGRKCLSFIFISFIFECYSHYFSCFNYRLVQNTFRFN